MSDNKEALDKEFAEFRAGIGEKLNQAAELITSCVKDIECCEFGHDETYFLSKDGAIDLSLSDVDFYHECRALFAALQKAGWSSSSMRC